MDRADTVCGEIQSTTEFWLAKHGTRPSVRQMLMGM